jgi:hypothetical protein
MTNRKAIPDNVLDRIDKLERLVKSLLTRDLKLARLSDLTPDGGDQRAGRFLALSAGGEPTDADTIGTFVSADGESFGGTIYHIGGVNLGVIQWGANSLTGAFMAGAEAMKLDKDGLTIIGSLTPESRNKITFRNAANTLTLGEIFTEEVGELYRMVINSTGELYLDEIFLSTDLAVTYGGTGASTAAAARTNLGAAPSVNPIFTNPRETPQTLTDQATITWNMNSGGFATVTLAGNRTMAAPSNLKNGGSYVLVAKQDGTGSRTLAYNAVFFFPGGTDPILSTAANAVDILTFVSDGTNLYGVAQKAFA